MNWMNFAIPASPYLVRSRAPDIDVVDIVLVQQRDGLTDVERLIDSLYILLPTLRTASTTLSTASRVQAS